MGFPSSLVIPAVLVSLTALPPGTAAAQSAPLGASTHITQVASVTPGVIFGVVLDEASQPLDGVVVSALGGGSGFAITDPTGRYILSSLPHGPYLVRAHLQGYLPARNTMVDVRPSTRTASSFTLRRTGTAAAPRVAEAGIGLPGVDAVSAVDDGDRDTSETAWRLRHLKRSVLKDSTGQGLVGETDEDGNFLGDSFERLGRAFGQSARVATAFFADTPFQGEVNLLTTGAFDAPGQFFDLNRASQVAFLTLGAPVGEHGNWTVNAALNDGDLSSWILAGQYAVREPARHRYTFGMSYGLQRYNGGNTVALAALPDSARNVGAVYAYDQWVVSRSVTVGYGGSYAHYDYLAEPSLFSPRLSATFSPTPVLRIHASAARRLSAPGAEEFLPPSRAEYLPPQRTFSTLSPSGDFRTEEQQHYEVGVERILDRASVGVRAFRERIDDQLVTVFGLREPNAPASALGHYRVGSAGDVDVSGVGVTFTHALMQNLRGSFDYSISSARWFAPAPTADYAVFTRWVPAAVRPDHERVQDFTSSLQAELPQTLTRIVVLYKLNTAFVNGDGTGIHPGVGTRFDLQLNQALPFMNFSQSQWEMLVAVRNLFHESLADISTYDELLVVRPPKRVVGGITVKF